MLDSSLTENAMSGIQFISLAILFTYKILRKLLFIDTYWILDKFLFQLLMVKFSGMTGFCQRIKTTSTIPTEQKSKEIIQNDHKIKNIKIETFLRYCGII